MKKPLLKRLSVLILISTVLQGCSSPLLQQLTKTQQITEPKVNEKVSILPRGNIVEKYKPQSMAGKVEYVIDGDTIKLVTGEVVHYIGIDSPEAKHPLKSVEDLGKEATKYNRRLVEGKGIKLIFGVQSIDKYGRLLAYVYLHDGTFVNAELIKGGYARVSTGSPNIKHEKLFLKLQNEAKEAKCGLWGNIEVVQQLIIEQEKNTEIKSVLQNETTKIPKNLKPAKKEKKDFSLYLKEKTRNFTTKDKSLLVSAGATALGLYLIITGETVKRRDLLGSSSLDYGWYDPPERDYARYESEWDGNTYKTYGVYYSSDVRQSIGIVLGIGGMLGLCWYMIIKGE